MTCNGCKRTDAEGAEFYSYCRTLCKSCTRKRQSAYNAAHREEINAKMAAYYAANRERVCARLKAKRAAEFEWHSIVEMPDELTCVRCGIVGPLKLFCRNRASLCGHEAVCRRCKHEAKAEWRKKYPDRNVLNATSYRARKYNAPVNDLTPAQWASIKERFNLSCAYCGERVSVLTQDHVIPLSKGGGHTQGNVVPACSRCNAAKNDRPLEEFLKSF